MSRVLLAMLVLITSAVSGHASETKGFYASLSSGFTFLNSSSPDVTLDLKQPHMIPLKYAAKTEFKTGYNVSSSLGYDFGAIRLESEIRFAKSKIKAYHNPWFSLQNIDGKNYWVQSFTVKEPRVGNASSLSLMVNSFYEFENKSIFTPHLMCGVGLSKISYKDKETITNQKSNDKVFAYQFGTGISTALSKKTSIDLSYRYFATKNAKFKGYINGPPVLELNYKSHNLTLGVRYLF